MTGIDRPHYKRVVKWRSSQDSNAIDIRGGAGFKLYVPATFSGTTITIFGYVKRCIDPDDAVAGEEEIDDYKEYNNGTVTVTADQVHDLTSNQLFGLDKIKLQSDSSENCTGELTMSS